MDIITPIKQRVHHNKKMTTGVLAATMILSIVYIVCMDTAIASEGLHSTTWSRKLQIKNCGSGYANLRKMLKYSARTHCRAAHGSGKINTLQQENFTKLSCEKIKEGNKTVSVRVKGTLTNLCN